MQLTFYRLFAGLVLPTTTMLAGPISRLYLPGIGNTPNIAIVQGNTIISTFAEAYQGPYEVPIAVNGDVRTAGYFSGSPGGQYTLSGTPTGVTYSHPGAITGHSDDSTTDGSYNYLMDFDSGISNSSAPYLKVSGTSKGYSKKSLRIFTLDLALWNKTWQAG